MRRRAPSFARRGCGVMVALAVTALATPAAMAFKLIGLSWSSQRARYSVNPSAFPAAIGGTSEVIRLIRCGAEAWRGQSAAEFTFEYGGTSSRSVRDESDNVNVVFFSPTEDVNGALATTFFYQFRGRSEFAGFDMIFWRGLAGTEFQWRGAVDEANAVGEFDLWGAVTHEFGHALGLDHTPVEDATMYFQLRDTGQRNRLLRPDDLEGVETLYGRRQDERPSPTISLITPSEGPPEGGNSVVVEGGPFSFAGDLELRFGATLVPRQQIHVEHCGRLVVQSVPAGEGNVDVTLRSSQGEAPLPRTYSYLDPRFIRGDADRDGGLTISDVVAVLFLVFVDGTASRCPDAHDADDDGELRVHDALYLLLYLFAGGEAPRPPFPARGNDPTTGDLLNCR